METCVRELMGCFCGSFINSNNELILDRETNLYFLLDNIGNEVELKCKVLEFCSRDAFKSEPFEKDYLNKSYQNKIRENINEFLGTSFSRDDMDKIYCNLGNRVNHEKTIRFIKSGYKFNILEAI